VTTEKQSSIYEMSLSFRMTWQAHSLSNIGSNGSNRLWGRRQLLANGTETDALSGNIFKHHHAMLVAEYFEADGIPLCPACSVRDMRRLAALGDTPEYNGYTIERALRDCGLCDTHGFAVLSKNAAADGTAGPRQGLSKHTLLEFSFLLALPENHAESLQLFTRSGGSKEDGQMIMKMPSRSGIYGQCIRYKSVGIGVDTDKWMLVLDDQGERTRRHRAILSALRDQLLSPSGALTAKLLPHLSDLEGVIAIRSSVGRAPVYSPIEKDYVDRLRALSSETCEVLTFDSVDSFNERMTHLIETTVPAIPAKSPRPPRRK
jgi:CRISPR-associated protein Cst2